MDDKLTIFIAVTSAAVVLQMLILAAMYFTMRKLSATVEKTTEEVRTKVFPVIENAKALQAQAKSFIETNRPKVEQVVDNVTSISSTARNRAQKLDVTVGEVTDRARLQFIRADQLLTRTMDSVEDTTAKVQHSVASPIRHVNGLVQALSVGFGAFFEKQHKRGKNGMHDEMFI